MIYLKRLKRICTRCVLHLLSYFKRIGIALSVLFNVILGGASNQTFSARQYDRKREGKANLGWLIDTIVWADPDHCMMSWLYWKTHKNIRLVKGKYGNEHLHSPEFEKPMGNTGPERTGL